MRKLFLIAKRDYLSAVRTKAFVIGLLSGPILFGGSFFGSVLLKQQPSTQVRRIGILDRTGVAAQALTGQLKTAKPARRCRQEYGRADHAEL